jgi:hypothetical protein
MANFKMENLYIFKEIPSKFSFRISINIYNCFMLSDNQIAFDYGKKIHSLVLLKNFIKENLNKRNFSNENLKSFGKIAKAPLKFNFLFDYFPIIGYELLQFESFGFFFKHFESTKLLIDQSNIFSDTKNHFSEQGVDIVVSSFIIDFIAWILGG